MKTRLSLALLCTLASPFLLADVAVPDSNKKEVRLELTADSTREQVFAMFKAQGIAATDAQVDEVMAKLAAAKSAAKTGGDSPAPAAPKKGKEVKLELTPDSTREQVIAALKAQGVAGTDAQVDDLMARLAAAKSGGKSPAAKNAGVAKDVNPDPTEATDSAASVAMRKYLRSEYAGMDLDYDPTTNIYYARGKVNDVDARFMLDSGAGRSHLAAKSAEKFGLVLKDAGEGRGIGGTEKSYTTAIKSMNIGPHIRLPAQPFAASAFSGAASADDGLLGSELLGKLGGIIDFRTHRMMYPKPGSKVDLAEKARACGMEQISLNRTGGFSVLEGKVGGSPVRFIVDTGAQQTVLDSATAKRLGVSAIPIATRAAGIGDDTMKLESGTLGDLVVGKMKLSRMPVLLMSLDHVQMAHVGKIDGILGADFLYASDAIFDVGTGKLYVEPGVVDVRQFTKTGAELFASDAELKAAWAGVPRVIVGKVRSYAMHPETTTDVDGRPCRIVEVTMAVTETLKGAASTEKTEVVRVTVPLHENLQTYLSGIFGRNNAKIVFLPAVASGGVPPKLSMAFWTDGELPRAQLKRIR